MDADTRHRLAAARLWATHRFPYLSSALFAMSVVPAPGIGTVAVDRSWRLYVDPEVINAESVEALGITLVHHTGHLLRDHGGRATTRAIGETEGPRWTAAADAEINDDLIDAGLHLHHDEVTPGRLGMRDGLLAEQYYDEMGEPPRSPDHGSGADGRQRSWENDASNSTAVSADEAGAIRLRVAIEIVAAARTAGAVSGGWQRWAELAVGGGIDWRRALAGELRRGVASVAGLVDYTYRRPSRRAGASPGVILPALERPLPGVAIVCDTSGSIDEADLTTSLGEVDGIMRRLGLHDAVVLSVDATVHEAQRVSRVAQVRLSGGGGTDMAAGIVAATALRPRPDIVVVLTDGYTTWPVAKPPGVLVVIGLIGTGTRPPPTPSWARTVKIPKRAASETIGTRP